MSARQRRKPHKGRAKSAGTEVPAGTLKRVRMALRATKADENPPSFIFNDFGRVFNGAPHGHAGLHPFGWALPPMETGRNACATPNSVEKFSNFVFGLGLACGNLCDFVRTKFLHAEAEMDGLFESFGPSPRDPLPWEKGRAGLWVSVLRAAVFGQSPDLLYRSV